MFVRHASWILICVLGISSCGRDSDAQRDNTSPTNSKLQNDSSALTFPSRFDVADKLKRDSNGVVSLLQGVNLSSELEEYSHYQQLANNKSFGEMAVEFVHFFKTPFQLQDPKTELSVTRVQEDDLGFHQVRLAQNYKSVPVLHSELIVHFDQDDHVYLVQGQYIQSPIALNLKPRMTAQEVNQFVIDHGYAAAEVIDSSPLILPPSDGQPRLVYQLKSNVSLTDQSILLVDANNGEVIRKLRTIYNAN